MPRAVGALAPLAALVFAVGLLIGMLSVEMEVETVVPMTPSPTEDLSPTEAERPHPAQQKSEVPACRRRDRGAPVVELTPFRGMLGPAADWASTNVPRFESSDGDLTTAYYYRWQVFWRHLSRSSDDGWTLSEFLPHVNWAGPHGTINCACEWERVARNDGVMCLLTLRRIRTRAA